MLNYIYNAMHTHGMDWLSGNGVNEVTLRRARLVMRWVTVYGMPSSACRRGM